MKKQRANRNKRPREYRHHSPARTKERTERIAVITVVLTAAATIAAFFQIPAFQQATGSIWRRMVPQGYAIVVGSMNFPEQRVVAEIIAQLLENEGTKVLRAFNQTPERLRVGIEDASVDIYVEYTGVIYRDLLKQSPNGDPAAVYAYVESEYAQRGIEVSKPFGYEDEWAVLLAESKRTELRINSISELARWAPALDAAFPPDFMDDKTCGLQALKNRYGLHFRRETRLQLPDIYSALAKGEVAVIVGNSTDPQIDEIGLAQLRDDGRHFPPYQPVILARRNVAKRVPTFSIMAERVPSMLTLREVRLLGYKITKNPERTRETIGEWLVASGLNPKKNLPMTLRLQQLYVAYSTPGSCVYPPRWKAKREEEMTATTDWRLRLVASPNTTFGQPGGSWGLRSRPSTLC